MVSDFSTEYSNRTDGELLQLASDRHSLTTEAASALDTELRRRNFTESDRIEHQRFVKRPQKRESRSHRRKIFGMLNSRFTWIDLLWALAAMALISFTYLALPQPYRMKADWQEAAVYVMIPSIVIVVTGKSTLWRKSVFWISLVISSAIHLVVVHAWTKRVPDLSHAQGKGAAFLGFFLFLAVFGLVSFLRRNIYGKEESGTV